MNGTIEVFANNSYLMTLITRGGKVHRLSYVITIDGKGGLYITPEIYSLNYQIKEMIPNYILENFSKTISKLTSILEITA